MKILNWNIEWMNHWFSGNATPVWGSRLPGEERGALSPDEARIVAGRVAAVIRELDPDLICLQEGPSSIEEMQLFLDDFLSDAGGSQFEPLIGIGGRSQKLYVLRRKTGRVVAMDYARDADTLALRDV